MSWQHYSWLKRHRNVECLHFVWEKHPFIPGCSKYDSVKISMKHVCHFCHIFMFVTSVCKALLLISPMFFVEFKFVTVANIMLSCFRYTGAVIRRQMNTLYYFWSNNLNIYHQRCQTARNIAWKSSTQCPLLPHVCLPENVFVAIHLSLLRISGHDALK